MSTGPVSFWHADLPEVCLFNMAPGGKAVTYSEGLAFRPTVPGVAWRFVRRATVPQIDRDEIPTYAMQAWLVAEGLLTPGFYFADPIGQRLLVRRLIREYFPGGVDAFLRSHAYQKEA